MTFEAFIRTYWILNPKIKIAGELLTYLETSGVLLRSHYYIGHTKIFLKYEAGKILDNERFNAMNIRALLVQRRVRGHLQINRFKRWVKLQVNIKRAMATKNIANLREYLCEAKQLPHEGMTVPLIRSAVAMMVRVDEEISVSSILHAAIQSSDMDSLESAIKTARAMNPPFELQILRDATAALQQLRSGKLPPPPPPPPPPPTAESNTAAKMTALDMRLKHQGNLAVAETFVEKKEIDNLSKANNVHAAFLGTKKDDLSRQVTLGAPQIQRKESWVDLIPQDKNVKAPRKSVLTRQLSREEFDDLSKLDEAIEAFSKLCASENGITSADIETFEKTVLENSNTDSTVHQASGMMKITEEVVKGKKQLKLQNELLSVTIRTPIWKIKNFLHQASVLHMQNFSGMLLCQSIHNIYYIIIFNYICL
jgi:hypothetical protein